MNSSARAYSVCEQPIFIIAAPRSGADQIRKILLQHPDLWSGGEGGFIQPLLDSIQQAWQTGRRYGRCQWLVSQHVTRPEFWRYMGLGINALYGSRCGNQRWLEVICSQLHSLPMLAELFPRAQFLHVRRDGRQVVQSIHQRWRWPYVKACRLWSQASVQIDGFIINHAQRVHSLQLEALAEASGDQLHPLLDFLGLPASRDVVQAMTSQAGSCFSQKRPADGPPGRKQNWMQRYWFDWTCGRLENRIGNY